MESLIEKVYVRPTKSTALGNNFRPAIHVEEDAGNQWRKRGTVFAAGARKVAIKHYLPFFLHFFRVCYRLPLRGGQVVLKSKPLPESDMYSKRHGKHRQKQKTKKELVTQSVAFPERCISSRSFLQVPLEIRAIGWWYRTDVVKG